MLTRLVSMMLCGCAVLAQAEWVTVYTQDFENVPAGTKTGAGALANWEQFSAAGVVHDGQPKKAGGHFLVPQHGWSSFNQGPIFNLDLAATPHDRVRVSFNLYTLGDWRGLQAATGGPAHRLMFFDSKAEPRFGFSTCFASNRKFKQSWPEKMGAKHPAGKGGKPAPELDATGRFKGAMRWPVQFEYASKSKALRFTFLCGAAAGSGAKMPPYGIDDVKGGQLTTTVQSKTKLISANLHYTTGPHPQNKTRAWKTIPLKVDGQKIHGAAPPKSATVWYVDVRDERKYLVSSEVMGVK